MLRRAWHMILALAIAAIVAGLWRGRAPATASAAALERLRSAHQELRLLHMQEEIGGKSIDTEFIERERAISAELAIAEFDAATDIASRLAAAKGHLERMRDRQVKVQLHNRWEFFDPTALRRQTRQNVTMAEVWVQLLSGY